MFTGKKFMAMSALLVALAGCASPGEGGVEEASLTAAMPSISSAPSVGFEALDLDTVSGSGGSLGA